jgi:site-specific DNA-methyltransferase (adenine-specific)/modification methylase
MKSETLGPNGEATIYLGDCLEILPTLTGVDAVVTDPPYGMNLNADFSGMANPGWKGTNGGNRYGSIAGDDRPFDPSPFLSIAPEVVLFGADYFMRDLPEGGSLSVWDKRLAESADKMFGSTFELVWFYPARKKDTIRHKWAGIFGTEKETEKRRIHPTQKPEGLMEKIVLRVRGTTILDPFMGSGTTGVACAKLGRRFIGIEIELKYYDIARKRISDAYAQGRLFAEPEPQPEQGTLI